MVLVHRQLADVLGLGGEALQHDELVARVLLQLGPLVQVQAVLDGQLVQSVALPEPVHHLLCGLEDVDPLGTGPVEQLLAAGEHLVFIQQQDLEHARVLAPTHHEVEHPVPHALELRAPEVRAGLEPAHVLGRLVEVPDDVEVIRDGHGDDLAPDL